MKEIFILIIGMIAGYAAHTRGSNGDITYNETGNKIVISTCDKTLQCQVDIGRACEDDGFKVINTTVDTDSIKIVMTAQCGMPKNHSWF